MTTFLQALVNAALARCPDTEHGVARVSEALRVAVGLVGHCDGWDGSAATVVRMWEVTFLPGILRPDSAAKDNTRAGFSAYARALEELFL